MIYENKIQQKTAAVFIVSTLVLANKVCAGVKVQEKEILYTGEKISVNEKDETNIEGNHSRVYYILFTGNN